jgi:hypothetical protein
MVIYLPYDMNAGFSPFQLTLSIGPCPELCIHPPGWCIVVWAGNLLWRYGVMALRRYGVVASTQPDCIACIMIRKEEQLFDHVPH